MGDTDDSFKDNGKWHLRPNKWAINPDEVYRQKEFTAMLHRCFEE